MSDRIVRDPLGEVTDHIITLADAIMNRTGKHGVTRVSLTPDVGLSFGLAPGTSVDVHTPAGRVEVYAERTKRADGIVTIDPLTGDAVMLLGDVKVHVDPTMPRVTVVAPDPDEAACGAALERSIRADTSGVVDIDEPSRGRRDPYDHVGFAAGVLTIAWDGSEPAFELVGRGPVMTAEILRCNTKSGTLPREAVTAALTGLVVYSPSGELRRIGGVESKCITPLGEGACLGLLLLPLEAP